MPTPLVSDDTKTRTRQGGPEGNTQNGLYQASGFEHMKDNMMDWQLFSLFFVVSAPQGFAIAFVLTVGSAALARLSPPLRARETSSHVYGFVLLCIHSGPRSSSVLDKPISHVFDTSVVAPFLPQLTHHAHSNTLTRSRPAAPTWMGLLPPRHTTPSNRSYRAAA